MTEMHTQHMHNHPEGSPSNMTLSGSINLLQQKQDKALSGAWQAGILVVGIILTALVTKWIG